MRYDGKEYPNVISRYDGQEPAGLPKGHLLAAVWCDGQPELWVVNGDDGVKEIEQLYRGMFQIFTHHVSYIQVFNPVMHWDIVNDVPFYDPKYFFGKMFSD